jgi:hypothetical protein
LTSESCTHEAKPWRPRARVEQLRDAGLAGQGWPVSGRHGCPAGRPMQSRIGQGRLDPAAPARSRRRSPPAVGLGESLVDDSVRDKDVAASRRLRGKKTGIGYRVSGIGYRETTRPNPQCPISNAHSWTPPAGRRQYRAVEIGREFTGAGLTRGNGCPGPGDVPVCPVGHARKRCPTLFKSQTARRRRDNCGLSIADCGLSRAFQSAIRNPKLHRP